YQLCDLSAYDDDEIRGLATLKITLLALKYVFHPDLRRKLPRIVGVLNQLLTTDMDALECLRIVMQYLARARGLTAKDFKPAIEHVFGGESDRIMSNFFDDAIQQGLRQGLQQGRQQGRQEGRQEGLREGRRQGAEDLTLRQLSLQIGPVGPRVEKRIRKLTTDQLERLGVDLLKFTGPKDLTAWLREQLGH
ncbi:MAG TPA: DUF4351 domain-containing protein, partial [Blastocatellia bacterium]